MPKIGERCFSSSFQTLCWGGKKVYEGACRTTRVVCSLARLIFSAFTFPFKYCGNFLLRHSCTKKSTSLLKNTDSKTDEAFKNKNPIINSTEIEILIANENDLKNQIKDSTTDELKREIEETFSNFHKQETNSLKRSQHIIQELWSRDVLTPQIVTVWQQLMENPIFHDDKENARKNNFGFTVKELRRNYQEKAGKDSLNKNTIISSTTLSLGAALSTIFNHPRIREMFPVDTFIWDNNQYTYDHLFNSCKKEPKEKNNPILGTLICLSIKKQLGDSPDIQEKRIDQFLESERPGSTYVENYTHWYHSLEKIKTCLYVVPYDPWNDLSEERYAQAVQTISSECSKISRASNDWKPWIHALLLVAANPKNANKESPEYAKTTRLLSAAIDEFRKSYFGKIPYGSMGNADGVFQLFTYYYSKEIWDNYVSKILVDRSNYKKIFTTSRLQNHHYTSEIYISADENYTFNNSMEKLIDWSANKQVDPKSDPIYVTYDLMEHIKADDRTFDISWIAIPKWTSNNCYLSAVLIKWLTVSYGYRSSLQHVINHLCTPNVQL